MDRGEDGVEVGVDMDDDGEDNRAVMLMGDVVVGGDCGVDN